MLGDVKAPLIRKDAISGVALEQAEQGRIWRRVHRCWSAVSDVRGSLWARGRTLARLDRCGRWGCQEISWRFGRVGRGEWCRGMHHLEQVAGGWRLLRRGIEVGGR